MCYGVGETGSTVMMIVGIASAAVSAYGSYSQQRSLNTQARYKKREADNNAATAKLEAQYIRTVTAEKAKKHRQKVAHFVGKQRAEMGASGIVVDEGSFLDVTLDTVEQGKLDEMALLYEGDKEAWRAEVVGGNYTNQGRLYSMSEASPAATAAPVLMSGVARAGTSYYNLP